MPLGIYQHKPHSEETKRKMSIAKKGKRPKNLESLWKLPWTNERREKMRQLGLGRKQKEESNM